MLRRRWVISWLHIDARSFARTGSVRRCFLPSPGRLAALASQVRGFDITQVSWPHWGRSATTPAVFYLPVIRRMASWKDRPSTWTQKSMALPARSRSMCQTLTEWTRTARFFAHRCAALSRSSSLSIGFHRCQFAFEPLVRHLSATQLILNDGQVLFVWWGHAVQSQDLVIRIIAGQQPALRPVPEDQSDTLSAQVRLNTRLFARRTTLRTQSRRQVFGHLPVNIDRLNQPANGISEFQSSREVRSLTGQLLEQFLAG